MMVTLTPELSEFLAAEDQTFQAEFEAERQQRELGMYHQEQLLGAAVEQHMRLEESLSDFKTTAEAEFSQIAEAINCMCTLAETWEAERHHAERASMMTPSSTKEPILHRISSLTSFRLQRDRCSGSFCEGLATFVQSTTFDAITASVICLNALCVGVKTDIEIKNHREPVNADRGVYIMLKFFFPPFYVLELALKLAVFRCGFFTNDDKMWNMFDLLLVLTGAYDQLSEMTQVGGGSSNMGWMRMLRLLKMMKMLRMVRVMRFFKELRIMLHAIVGSLRSFFWTVLMLSLIMYIFGIAFLQAITSYLTETPQDQLDKDGMEETALTYYGGVHLSMLTLFQAITGGNDWENLALPLQSAGEIYYGLFLFYVAFLTFAVLNVLTGIFVENAMNVAQRDRDNVIQEEMDREKSSINALRKLFNKIDEDNSGSLTLQEFKGALGTVEVRGSFEAMELSVSEAKELFHLLDTSGSHTVNIEEFINGCTKLRGIAKSIDLVTLKTEQKAMSRKLLRFMGYIEDAFDDIWQFFERSEAVKSTVEPLKSRYHKAKLNV